MSYFEIGIYHTKTETNVGTLWRSAFQLGASGIFTIGHRYKKQSSDTTKSWKHIPLRQYESFEEFNKIRPQSAILIGVEMGGITLKKFKHPKQAIYLLGAEDHGLPPAILEKCNQIVSLQAINRESFNVAVAGSIIMYDRSFINIDC